MTSDKPAEEHYFTIDGKRLDKLQKGLNIVVMPDGATRKVVVK